MKEFKQLDTKEQAVIRKIQGAGSERRKYEIEKRGAAAAFVTVPRW